MTKNNAPVTYHKFLELLLSMEEVAREANKPSAEVDFKEEYQKLKVYSEFLDSNIDQVLSPLLENFWEFYRAIDKLEKAINSCKCSALRGQTIFERPGSLPDAEVLVRQRYLLKFISVLQDFKENVQVAVKMVSPYELVPELLVWPPGQSGEDYGMEPPVLQISAEASEGDLTEEEKKKRDAVFRITIAKLAHERGRKWLEQLSHEDVQKLIAKVVKSSLRWVQGQYSPTDPFRYTVALHEDKANAFLNSLSPGKGEW